MMPGAGTLRRAQSRVRLVGTGLFRRTPRSGAGLVTVTLTPDPMIATAPPTSVMGKFAVFRLADQIGSEQLRRI